MSRNNRILLGVIGGLLLICCIGVILVVTIVPRMAGDFFESAVAEDTGAAADIGAEIVDYSLPAGYQEAGGMNMLGTRMVFIESGNSAEEIIMLMQLPSVANANPDDLERQMQDALSQQQGTQNYDLEFVGSEEIIINGEPTNLTIREGASDGGDRYRQMTAVFQAKAGTGMVMILGPVSTWNEAAIDQFLASMR